MPPPAAAAPPLIVVAASARALAASAYRAGWAVHAADLFADADLRATAARAVRVSTGTGLPWPRGLETCLADFPAAPWLYGGALENHADLVDRLARARPLAGIPGERLRAVRDPAALARAVVAAGFTFPATLTAPARVPTDGSWLLKPRASAGGHGIVRWHGGTVPAGDHVWQRFVPGRPWSVAFAIAGSACRVFGASRQLVGRAWCNARGYAWSGAVDVPISELAAGARTRLERLGHVLAGEFGLLGLVGVDLVVDRAGVIHVIEVNPRPTASMELVERATGESVVATHLAAWGLAAAGPRQPAARPAAWAKAIVFADRNVVIDAAVDGALAERSAPWSTDDGWPALADLPAPGTAIDAGRPALTVYAAARHATDALRRLKRRAAAIRTTLRSAAVSQPSAGAWRQPHPPRGNTA